MSLLPYFQVLHNFHDMVMGNSQLFGTTPVFNIFEKTLNPDSSNYWSSVTEIAAFLYGIQVSGYAAWFTALNIKGRHSEVAKILTVARNRLAEQKRVMDPLTIRK